MPVSMQVPSAAEFLRACAVDSQTTYEQLTALLMLLEQEPTRVAARRLVSELQAAGKAFGDLQAFEDLYHFSLRVLALAGPERDEQLLLLQLPSTFTPEEWSFTFYEGLTRYATEGFAGKHVCEVGCGNGWVSLALARRTGPGMMLGVDINPKAVLSSRINLYVNALDDTGVPVIDRDGRCLLEKVRFAESDLLSYCYQTQMRLDMIVGCIPQVLSPDPQMRFDHIDAQASDAFLYSLSNYAPSLGYIEDQFGLGLIAKALEQAIAILQPGGKVLLNLGGRPGTRVLEHLFARRGYHCRRIWQRKVWQAADTDITPLVDIEQRSAHRFEFYVGLTSDQPINATTAQAFVRCGGRVAHALGVYEASLRHPAEVRAIFSTLSRPQWQRVREVVDLAFPTPSVEDEKTHFLATLCTALQSQQPLHYDETRGNAGLRRSIARFLQSYHRVPWDPEQMMILPNRGELIRAVLYTYRPSRILLSTTVVDLSEDMLPRQLMQQLRASSEVYETPCEVDVTCKLVETLTPQVLITQLNAHENHSVDSVIRLITTCGAHGVRLFVDISPYLDVSSEPEFNSVFRFLSDHPLPAHVAIFAGLVKNQVYEHLQVCVLLSANPALLTQLRGAAELGYSRTPTLSQLYYASLFDDLLSFHMKGVREQPAPAPAQAETPGTLVSVSLAAAASFTHPSVTTEQLPITRETIRLDYGENALPVPEALSAEILAAFVRRELPPHECEPYPAIAALLAQRYGLDSHGDAGRIRIGLGVAPIFAALVEHCQRQGKTLLVPMGSYGMFTAASTYHGCQVQVIATERTQHFKLTPRALHQALEAYPGSWVYSCYPVVNPTGALYSASELADLLSVCKAHQALVILDTLFHGLEFHAAPGAFHLGAAAASQHLPAMVCLGGVSKEYAAGGLRFGYAWTNEASVADHLDAVLSTPHETVQLAVRRLLERQVVADPTLLTDLAEQRRILRARATRLADVLGQTGWEPLPSSGGLFLVATPTALLGATLTYPWAGQPKSITLNASNIAEALFATCGLLINNDVWTGIPGFCRFVLSVSEAEFARGLAALQVFPRLLA